ncbi:MAG: lipopolysaccharide heptosyltransferase II [Elusimicrobia bacterium]|jgi:heptosyltransferase-2|nr:lipopolysaccharide heptosyltransferase II [Elusimicrobiota bacterium]
MTKRVLVRAPNWLGDAIMATPFVKRLATRSPGIEIDVLTKLSLASIYQGAPGVANVLPLDSRESPWATARKLRSKNYEAAYVLPPSFSAALSPWLAGIPRRVGYAGQFRRGLLTESPVLDERFHYVRRYMGLLGEANKSVGVEDLFVPRTTEKEKEQFLKKGVDLGSGKILAVAPGSRAPARRWFPERFAEVIDGLGPEWATVLILGAPEDQPFADDVARLSRRPTLNLCGQTSIPLVADLLTCATVLLTNESGLMHVGWAVGVPLVVLAGPSNPRLTSPFGPQVRVIQTDQVPCVPCVRNECPLRGGDHQLCLKKIEAKTVIETIDSLLH